MICTRPIIDRHTVTRALIGLAFAAAVLGCEGQEPESEQAQDESAAEQAMESDTMAARGMGMGVSTAVLAEEHLAEPPAEEVAWAAYDLSGASADLMHNEEAVFLYAAEGAHGVTIGDRERMLEEGEAVAVPAGTGYMHAEQEGLWVIALTTPGGAGPSGLDDSRTIFESGMLRGIPRMPIQMRLLRVQLAPGEETLVHQHPGPEYIYVTEGTIQYQAGERGGIRLHLGPGEDDAIPAYTPVQKRNPHGETASFLALFLVDPGEDFTQSASF